MEPEVAHPRANFRADNQANQEQTHTQQPEQNHAVSTLAQLWARRHLGRNFHPDPPGTSFQRVCWSR